MFCYREIVQGYRTIDNKLGMGIRGRLVDVGYNFADWEEHDDMFYSIWGYPEFMPSEDVINYRGERIIDHVPLDIDTLEFSVIKKIMDRLDKEPGMFYDLWFSGGGFHIILPNIWNFNTKDLYNRTIASTMKKHFPECDDSIYQARALIRMPNTNNLNDGKKILKVRLHNLIFYQSGISENWGTVTPGLMSVVAPRINKNIKPIGPDSVISSVGDIKPDRFPIVYSISQNHQVQVSPIGDRDLKSPICIHKLLKAGPIKGQRHSTSMRIASHMMHYDGYSPSFCLGSLKEWIKDPSANTHLSQIVIDVNEKYKYGCRDTILAAHCSPKCAFYLRRNYMSNAINIKDTLDEYTRKINNGEFYDLNDYYNIGWPFRILDNDVVTIVGAPGVGKSIFLIDAMVKFLKKDPTLTIMWSNLDTSHPLSVRRLMQNICHLSENEVLGNDKAVAKKMADAFELIHNRINLVEYSNLDTINKVLINPESYGFKKPDIWIIDDIGSIQSNYTGYDRMKFTASTIKMMAKSHNTMFLTTDHIPRLQIRNGNIDITSSKNAEMGERSDCVFAIVKPNIRVEAGKIKREKDMLNILSVKARDGKQFVLSLDFDYDHCQFNEICNATEGTGK